MLVRVGQSFQQARPFLSDIKMLSNHDTRYFSKKRENLQKKSFMVLAPGVRKLRFFLSAKVDLDASLHLATTAAKFFPRDFQLKDQRERESKKSP